MNPLDAVAPFPTKDQSAFWSVPPEAWQPIPLSQVARALARIERENPRISGEWRARGRRERVRRIGERLVAALRGLRVAEARMTLAESAIVAELARGDQYQSLGFVRQSDFAREALKLHPRTMRRRVALHRVLESAPVLVEPFLEGRIGVSQVLALRDVVTSENAKIWVNVAERLSVRELQSLARKAKERRDRDGTDDEAENVVLPAEAGHDAADPLEEPDHQRISFLSPQSAAFAIEHSLETARRAMGWEAPRDECFEAVMSEAESSLALPAATEEDVPGDETLVDPSENVVRAKVANPNDEPAADPNTVPFWYHKRDLKNARRFLTTVDRRLAKLTRLTETPQPAGALIDRYHALQRQKNPIRVLIARALHHLYTLGVGGMLGYQNNLDMAARLLKITPRSARDLLNAGFGFNCFPPLADAYARGQIGFGQVVSLSHAVGEDTRKWIHRAREVTSRQFRRELRLLRRLTDAAPNKLGFTDDAFPRPELESLLRKRLFELGWKQEELDRELGDRGILSPPECSTDPAENPALMVRLETLVDMLAIETCRRHEQPGIGKMLSVPGRHQRVTIMARNFIARHWRHIENRVQDLCGELPEWAVATLVTKAAQDEWDRTDPARIPTERKILERDGYLCQAPGCSSRKNLEVHHIIFRSLGGSNEASNLITLCHMHHHHAVHRHTMRVTGEAPYSITWEMGLRPDTAPRWVYRGERLYTDKNSLLSEGLDYPIKSTPTCPKSIPILSLIASSPGARH